MIEAMSPLFPSKSYCHPQEENYIKRISRTCINAFTESILWLATCGVSLKKFTYLVGTFYCYMLHFLKMWTSAFRKKNCKKTATSGCWVFVSYFTVPWSLLFWGKIVKSMSVFFFESNHLHVRFIVQLATTLLHMLLDGQSWGICTCHKSVLL